MFMILKKKKNWSNCDNYLDNYNKKTLLEINLIEKISFF